MMLLIGIAKMNTFKDGAKRLMSASPNSARNMAISNGAASNTQRLSNWLNWL